MGPASLSTAAIVLLSLALLDPAPVAPALPAAASLTTGNEAITTHVQGEHLVLGFTPGERVSMEDFLMLSQELLGRAITYNPQVVADTKLVFLGELSCKRAEYRWLFERILRRYDYAQYDSDTGPDAFIVVRSLRSPQSLRPSVIPRLTPEELDVDPERCTALYHVTLPVRNIDARNVIASIQHMLDNNYESARSVSHDAVVVTASLDRLRAVRDLVAALDFTGHAPANTVMESVASISERLQNLEEHLLGEAR